VYFLTLTSATEYSSGFYGFHVPVFMSLRLMNGTVSDNKSEFLKIGLQMDDF
jgi:hypothetical protein